MNRKIAHTMPGGQSEGFGYDLDGNQVLETNFDGAVIPNVANHIAMAQASGKPMVLTRTTPAQAVLNRVAATRLSPSAGIGRSLDEYPFASSIQGGFGASVVPVPALENSIQGGIIGGCYTIERITPGTAYIVVVTP